MKVILTQTVPKVGKEGTVVTVKDGYARNFLFPRGYAILADKKQVQALDRRNAKRQAQLDATRTDAEALREKLHGKPLQIEAKVGAEMGKLFGAVTSQDIADQLKSAYGVELDKRQIGLLSPIKRLGRYEILLDLHRDVDATLLLLVHDPEHPEFTEEKSEKVEEPPAEEAPEDPTEPI